MSNISTIATYLARVSGQLQPMLEKVQGMDRRTFLLEAAALLALPAHRKNGYLDTKALPWLIGSELTGR